MNELHEGDRAHLRPAPHSVKVQFASPWSLVTPSVFRYENQIWIDEFFESGKLRLSTFANFSTYPDEIRGDTQEGTAMCHGVTQGGMTVGMHHKQGTHAVVLCCSQKLDHELAHSFERDSVFEITNTLGFAFEISRQLIGFRQGLEGSCIYRSRNCIARELDMNFDDYLAEEGKLGIKFLLEAAQRLGGEELMLLKRKKYENQNEYRMIWELDNVSSDYCDVFAPNARQHCRKLSDKDWN